MFEGGNYFQNPTLLEFVAENPVRRGKLPENIVQVAKVILDAGVEPSALNETLMLVSTGRVPRECGVQLPLIDLLCDRDADPNSALHGAALHGEFEAVNALIRRGSRIDLPVAAALGRLGEVRILLPDANGDHRHMALALASQLGQVEVVQLLLDAGEDPNRYNPDGFHSHSTPLHQAVCSNHLEVVKLLVERGARLDLRDTIHQSTPLGWAIYCEKPALAEYLRVHGAPG